MMSKNFKWANMQKFEFIGEVDMFEICLRYNGIER